MQVYHIDDPYLSSILAAKIKKQCAIHIRLCWQRRAIKKKGDFTNTHSFPSLKKQTRSLPLVVTVTFVVICMAETSVPIGAWKCNFSPFQKIMTDRPTDLRTRVQKTRKMQINNKSVRAKRKCNPTSKPKQVLFFFRKSFAGIPREFRGRISLIWWDCQLFILIVEII